MSRPSYFFWLFKLNDILSDRLVLPIEDDWWARRKNFHW